MSCENDAGELFNNLLGRRAIWVWKVRARRRHLIYRFSIADGDPAVAGGTVLGLDNLNDYYDVRLKEARLARLSSHPQFQFVKLDHPIVRVWRRSSNSIPFGAWCIWRRRKPVSAIHWSIRMPTLRVTSTGS